MAITRDEVEEFSDENDTSDTDEDEAATCETEFIHVGGQPKHFFMPFGVHKTVIYSLVFKVFLDTICGAQDSVNQRGFGMHIGHTFH